VDEWERETGKHPLIALSACKDVQDAILADAKRAAVIDVIDLLTGGARKGAEYAPKGGTDLARASMSGSGKRPPNAVSIARMVREYRETFPGKAITTGLGEFDGWAFVAARFAA